MMNVKSLRSLFDKKVFSLDVQPGYLAMGGPLPAAANSAVEYYQKVTINKVNKTIQIRGAPAAGAADGVYIPAIGNTCTYFVLSANYDIVVSGRFTGCSFAICNAQAGTAVAHVYVDTSDNTNDPDAQITALETATNGTVLNTFATEGHLIAAAGEAEGFVFGTREAGTWKWHWVTKPAMNPGQVVTCRKIENEEWD
jgi:hypothetical protein